MLLFVLALAAALSSDEPRHQPRVETLVPQMAERGLDLDQTRNFVDSGLTEYVGAYMLTTAFRIDGQNRLSGMTVAFARVWIGEGDERRPVFHARLRARQGRRTVEVLVDERSCPQVLTALRRLETLPPLQINSPNLGPDDDWNPSIQLDGYSYTLATQARFEGGDTDFRTVIESVEGSPISAAVIDAAIELAPCWSAAGS